jgi:uncharacterized protein YukE
MLTADANIKSQQNLSDRNISIIVLRARNNRLATHVEMLDDVQNAISKAWKGNLVEVFHKDF